MSKKYRVGDRVLLRGTVTDVDDNCALKLTCRILVDGDETCEAEWFSQGAIVGSATYDDRRESLGKRVREVWVAWAKTQPNPKPEWLVPWEELEERYREVDRRIGAALWGDFVAEFSEQMSDLAMKAIEQVHHAKPN